MLGAGVGRADLAAGCVKRKLVPCAGKALGPWMLTSKATCLFPTQPRGKSLWPVQSRHPLRGPRATPEASVQPQRSRAYPSANTSPSRHQHTGPLQPGSCALATNPQGALPSVPGTQALHSALPGPPMALEMASPRVAVRMGKPRPRDMELRRFPSVLTAWKRQVPLWLRSPSSLGLFVHLF